MYRSHGANTSYSRGDPMKEYLNIERDLKTLVAVRAVAPLDAEDERALVGSLLRWHALQLENLRLLLSERRGPYYLRYLRELLRVWFGL